MKRKLVKLVKSLQKAPERKHYLEFITAALSIPVLLTVILLNLNSLNAKKETQNNQTQPTPQTVIIKETSPSNGANQTVITPSSSSCKKEVGPISISYPSEGAIITDNPVNFIIKYNNPDYCSVVWSYRINGGSWSEYSSNSPSIFNLPNGNVTFDLRIQSTVSQDQDQITRKFTYQNSSATPSPTAVVTPTP